MPLTISPSPRLRRSPFYDATIADGAVSFSPYNHMLMPTGYGDPMGEYWRLINGVAMWDVSVERQVQLAGPDAARLAQVLVPRKIAKQPVGMGWYAPVCDHRGVLINDPILLKLSEDRFWLSIADSDVLLWARAIAAERGLNVEVTEPDVSPLAIQGPKADDVVEALFDSSIRSMGYFRFREVELDGIPLMLARSGWSKQGGFELYLMDGTRGTDLWTRIKEAGKPFDIGPGCPNPMERIESGLLSWGGDTDDETNPFEVRMGRYVDLDVPDDTIGIKVLRRLQERGPKRHQVGIVMDMDGKLPYLDQRSEVYRGQSFVGHVTAHTWSPRLECNIGMALVWSGVGPGEPVTVVLPDGRQVEGEVRDLPFI